PGIYKMEVPVVGQFDALCDSQTAGPGWMVIQQRIGGKENFARDWQTYRKGFGNSDSDFFLGLEKIYRLTNILPHELYVHLVDLNGTVKYAHYDNFVVSHSNYDYTLESLGEYKGNASDGLRYALGKRFSTFDRDNDDYSYSCAEEYKSGWWFTNCYNG
ncbi:hypothetical protein KR044_004496, partial [Drosophila immigrans]